MRTITYSIICEDEAHKLFIQSFLLQFSEIINFQFNYLFYKKLLCTNSKQVLHKMVQAVDYSFLHTQGFYVDVLFIGIDYDDRDRTKFTHEINTLYNKLNDKGRQKAVIFFPVQAIEHWFLLIKQKKDNPTSTKNIATTIEKIDRKAAKTKLYNKALIQNSTLIKNVVLSINADWLSSQSVSFNHFYSKFKSSINILN